MPGSAGLGLLPALLTSAAATAAGGPSCAAPLMGCCISGKSIAKLNSTGSQRRRMLRRMQRAGGLRRLLLLQPGGRAHLQPPAVEGSGEWAVPVQGRRRLHQRRDLAAGAAAAPLTRAARSQEPAVLHGG